MSPSIQLILLFVFFTVVLYLIACINKYTYNKKRIKRIKDYNYKVECKNITIIFNCKSPHKIRRGLVIEAYCEINEVNHLVRSHTLPRSYGEVKPQLLEAITWFNPNNFSEYYIEVSIRKED